MISTNANTTGLIQSRIKKLKQNKSFQNLCSIIFEDKQHTACLYLKDKIVYSYTSEDYIKLINSFAVQIEKRIGNENKGKYVGIALDSCPIWPALFWACLKAGYNVLLLNFAATKEIMHNLLTEANAIAIISDKERHLDVLEINVNEIDTSVKNVEYTESTYGEYVALCTSGTTGNSRIFVYDSEAICEQVLSSQILYERCKNIIDNKNRKTLAFLPFHHVFGFLTSVLWCPFVGYTNVFLKDRAPNTILETCRYFRINLLISVPILANNICVGLEKKLNQGSAITRILFTILKKLSLFLQRIHPQFGIWCAKNVLFKSVLKNLLGNDIECIILGGSHTPKEHIATLSALGYYTVCGFGMTETAINSVETSMSLKKRLLSSVGMPLSNIEYKINPIGKNKNIGEMYIAGSTLHIGMLKQGILSPAERIDGKWFPTGDIVRIAKDSRVYVEGRCKDIIINESGENVYPDEIEDSFSKLQGIEQFSVIGIKKASESPYEDISLVINIGSNYTNTNFINEIQQQIININNTIPAIKRISRIVITPLPLPLVNGIKVKRLELKQNIETNKIAYKDVALKTHSKIASKNETESITTNAKPVGIQLNEIKQTLCKIFAEVLEVPADSINTAAHFIDDLGGDSLQILSIALKTEETFNVTIPVEQYPQCTSINDLSALLLALIQRESPKLETQSATPNTSITPLNEIKQSLCKIFAEALDIPIENIDTSAHFIDDLGGDSLQILSIALKTEEAFHVTIPVEQYPKCTNIDDLSVLLLELIQRNNNKQ